MLIEHAVGVLKARFPVWKRMVPFLLVTQRKITIAFFMLHNFIRKEGPSNEYCTQYNEPNVTFRNNNVCIDNNEYKVATHDTIADR